MGKNKSEKLINGVIGASGSIPLPPTNTPTQYGSRQKQYMADRTARFDANRAYLASDYVSAEVQGINPENFYEWVETNIRLADIATLTASATKKTDDFKEILLPELQIDYFPIGAKVNTMGSVWICVNPSNLSSAKANAVVARCNSSYNSYDHYGNVVTEPIVVEKYSMLGNDNESPINMVLMDGYFNITCQLNETTSVLRQNSRFILGNKPYHITGLTDFIQEFSGDRDSCHLLNFTARVEEPTEADDITVNFIANGKNYNYGAEMSGLDRLIGGTDMQTAQFTPIFTLNGDEIKATDEYPLTWVWQSSNPFVASVDENGLVTGKTTGSCTITATLQENPNIVASKAVSVYFSGTTHKVIFTGLIQSEIEQYDSATYTARYYDNSVETANALAWTFSGANAECYSASVADDGLSVEIMCLQSSNTPLTITASYGDDKASVNVVLEGF